MLEASNLSFFTLTHLLKKAVSQGNFYMILLSLLDVYCVGSGGISFSVYVTVEETLVYFLNES